MLAAIDFSAETQFFIRNIELALTRVPRQSDVTWTSI